MNQIFKIEIYTSSNFKELHPSHSLTAKASHVAAAFG